MKKHILIAAILGLLISSCGQKAESFEYYKAHLDEAADVTKKCKDQDKTDPNVKLNCQNAIRALTSHMFDNTGEK